MRLLAKLAVLSGSGLAASLGISLLLSGRLPSLNEHAADLSLFLTLQILAVTVAKLGVDQYSFAVVSSMREAEVSRSRGVLMASTVTCLGFGAWGWATSGVVFGFGLFASALLDAASLIRGAQFNARGRLLRVAAANLASYPLFFVLIVVKSSVLGFTLDSAILMLTLCSALRFAVLFFGHRIEGGVRSVNLRVATSLAAFGVGNFLVHRVDQVALSFSSAGLEWAGRSDQLRDYLLLARYAETVSGAWPLLGVIAFPALRDLLVARRWLGAGLLLIMVPISVAVGVGVFYFYIWTDSVHLALSSGIAFLLSGVLSFHVNFLAYILMGVGIEKTLGAATIALGILACVLGWPLLRNDPGALRWLVPSSLVMVCIACSVLLVGRSRLPGR